MPLEDLPPLMGVARASAPRASLVAARGSITGLRTEIWMGGAESLVGEALEPDWFASTWVLDCAGDMPAEYFASAVRREFCVFPDMEHRPEKLGRLLSLAAEFATAASSPEGPDRIVALCQHGMNRSGLATGLLLRELGLDRVDAVALIRRSRPGALSNRAFESILGEAVIRGDAAPLP